MSRTLASSDFELGFPSFISSSLILVDIMIVFRVIGFRGRCMRNIQGNHCKNSFRTFFEKEIEDANAAKVKTLSAFKNGFYLILQYFFLVCCIRKKFSFPYLIRTFKIALKPIIFRSLTTCFPIFVVM